VVRGLTGRRRDVSNPGVHQRPSITFNGSTMHTREHSGTMNTQEYFWCDELVAFPDSIECIYRISTPTQPVNRSRHAPSHTPTTPRSSYKLGMPTIRTCHPTSSEHAQHSLQTRPMRTTRMSGSLQTRSAKQTGELISTVNKETENSLTSIAQDYSTREGRWPAPASSCGPQPARRRGSGAALPACCPARGRGGGAASQLAALVADPAR